MISVNEKAKERLWSLLLSGSYIDCLKLARTIVAVQPENFNARMFEGVSLLELKDYDGAISALDECLRLRPDFSPALDSRAEAHFYKGDYDKALADIEKFLGYMENANSYGLASVCFYKKGERDRAYEYIDLAIKISEKDKHSFCIQKANFLESDGYIKEALEYYKTGLEKMPEDQEIKNKIRELEKT